MPPLARIPWILTRPLLGLAVAGALFAEPPAAPITGEVAGVDLGRRNLTVKVESPGAEPREIQLSLDDRSRIVSGGRTMTLDQVRAGERVRALCSSPDARGRRTCWVRIPPKWPARAPGS